MALSNPESIEIMQRLGNLESENRRLKRLAVVALALSTIPILVLLNIHPRLSFAEQRQAALRTITAYQYILRDSAGRTRAELGFSDIHGSPMLAFFGPSGRVRLQLFADSMGTNILTYSPGGGAFQAKMASSGDAAIIQASHLQKGAPKGTASLFSFKRTAQLVAEGPNGLRTIVGNANIENPKTRKIQHTNAASIVMLNKKGQVIWKAAPKNK